MARPLTKKDKQGNLYTRPVAIELAIDGLGSEDIDNVLNRAAIRTPSSRQTIPSEALVYLIRDAGHRDDEKTMNAALRVLLSRCEATLKDKVSRDEFPDAEQLRGDILGEFGVLFAADLTDPRYKLDYFECRFNRAFRTFYLRCIRRERAENEDRVEIPILDDPEDDRTDDDILTAMSNEHLRPWRQGRGELSEELLDAITALPTDERKAVLLYFYYGLPEESLEVGAPSVASLCGVTGRTIRNRLRKATTKLAKYLCLKEERCDEPKGFSETA